MEKKLPEILTKLENTNKINREDLEFVKSCCEYYGFQSIPMLIFVLGDVIDALIILVSFDKELAMDLIYESDFISKTEVLKRLAHEYGHFKSPFQICFTIKEQFHTNDEAVLLYEKMDKVIKNINRASIIISNFDLTNRQKTSSKVFKLTIDSAQEAMKIAEDFIAFLEKQEGDFKEKIKDMKEYLTSMRPFMGLLQDMRQSLLTPDVLVEYNLNKSLQEITEVIFGPYIKGEHFRLMLDLDKEIPDLRFYPDICFVWTNLCTNAKDAIEKEAHKWKYLKNPHKSIVKVTTTYDKVNANVIVSITDNGIGIPKSNMNKIWKGLFTTKEDGTGLGLTIVRDAVGHNDGVITVKSKPGKGATFTISLPAKISRRKVFLQQHKNDIKHLIAVKKKGEKALSAEAKEVLYDFNKAEWMKNFTPKTFRELYTFLKSPEKRGIAFLKQHPELFNFNYQSEHEALGDFLRRIVNTAASKLSEENNIPIEEAIYIINCNALKWLKERMGAKYAGAFGQEDEHALTGELTNSQIVGYIKQSDKIKIGAWEFAGLARYYMLRKNIDMAIISLKTVFIVQYANSTVIFLKSKKHDKEQEFFSMRAGFIPFWPEEIDESYKRSSFDEKIVAFIKEELVWMQENDIGRVQEIIEGLNKEGLSLTTKTDVDIGEKISLGETENCL